MEAYKYQKPAWSKEMKTKKLDEESFAPNKPCR
jgi:hypothetical protein